MGRDWDEKRRGGEWNGGAGQGKMREGRWEMEGN